MTQTLYTTDDLKAVVATLNKKGAAYKEQPKIRLIKRILKSWGRSIGHSLKLVNGTANTISGKVQVELTINGECNRSDLASITLEWVKRIRGFRLDNHPPKVNTRHAAITAQRQADQLFNEEKSKFVTVVLEALGGSNATTIAVVESIKFGLDTNTTLAIIVAKNRHNQLRLQLKTTLEGLKQDWHSDNKLNNN
jgi:hypothetical protein